MLIQPQCSSDVLGQVRKLTCRLAGTKIFLSPFTELCLTPEYISWFNDPVATQFTRHGSELYTIEKARKYYESVRNSDSVLVFAIHDAGTEAHLGNISLCDISWANRSGEIAIMLGHRESRGKGIGEESVKLVMDFAFSTVLLHRVKMGMTLSNRAMNRIAEKLGFIREGVFKDALFKNGTYHDIVQWAKIAS